MRRSILFSLLVFGLALATTRFTPPTSGRVVGILQGSSAWGRQTSGTTNELRSIHFINENEGWAAGANATLLHTTNGGANWAAVNTGVDPAKGFNTVRFLDRNVVLVGGATALARTSDGGASWITAMLPTALLFFENISHNNFSLLPPSSGSSSVNVISGGGGIDPGFGGQTACFGVQYSVSTSGALSRGLTFGTSPCSPILDIHFFIFEGSLEGWMVGGTGNIIRFDTRATGLQRFQISGTQEQLNGVQMMSLNGGIAGWIVGNNGTILKTTNGGDTWTVQMSGTTASLRDVHFVDANRGWAAGDSGVILTTSDGGATWATEQSGVIANLRGVFFVNANTGFAVGDGGTILKRGAPSGPTTVTTVSAASFTGAELAPESIVAAFGTGLATQTVVATDADPNTPGIQLPTELAGTTVEVKDSAGMARRAPLFFVSPTQVNYLMPSLTAPGACVVTIKSGDGKIAVGAIQAASVAPGLFTANASGQGVAAGVVLRVRGNNQSFEPIAEFDPAQNKFVAKPIDLGPEGDQVFLILYGGGFRFRSALSAVSVKMGGAEMEVLYAAEAPGFIGLDQLNVRLARSLMGRGEVDVILTVDGKAANTVRVSIK